MAGGERRQERDATEVKPDDAGDKAPDTARREAWSRQNKQPTRETSSSPERLEAAAIAIHKALDGWNNEEKVYRILEDKTESERKEINRRFQSKYNITLEKYFENELSGVKLDKALSLLQRKDGDADDAGSIRRALIERSQLFFGRSNETTEKVVRDTLRTMTSDQIKELDAEYRRRYKQPISEALLKNEHLSQTTKDAVAIYLKGTNLRTDSDTLRLSELALNNKRIDMFKESWHGASPQSRETFLSQRGEDRINKAFSGTDLTHALDYVRFGERSTATKIRDNSSWAGDNEKAIERALREMTAEQRERYLLGREFASRLPEPPTADQRAFGFRPLQDYLADKALQRLSDQQRQALAYYKEVRTALEKPGNATELARWEDMIKSTDGGLVSKLAAHRGTIYNDSINDIAKTIESVSKADWEQLKHDPQYRDEVKNVLKTLLSKKDVERCMEIVDRKKAALTYEDSAATGNRFILKAISDAKGVFNDNEETIYNAIEKMSPEEQKKYRENAQFKADVDQKIKSVLDAGAEQDAAFRMLNQITKGAIPTRDIVIRINIEAGKFSTDKAAILRDIQKTFADDPALRDRILKPANADDRDLSEQFKTALRRALGSSGYAEYGEHLLQTGRLPVEKQSQLSKGVFNDDEAGAYKDMAALGRDKSAAARLERHKLLHDSSYQDKVLGFLSKDERTVALNALRQGAVRPEDELRGALVGVGADKEKIKEVLSKLSADEKEQAKSEYAKKYGTNLTSDVIAKIGGQERIDVLRLLERTPATARESFNRSREEYYSSRDGFGKWWVDKVWDGTGYSAEDALNKYASFMERFSQSFNALSAEKQKELTGNLRQSLDLFRESKGAAADALIDATITTAAVGGAVFTKGVSLSLLAATGFGAALFKVGAKSAITGSDYDWRGVNVAMDATSGLADGVLSFVGPGQIGKILKVGEKAAQGAAQQVLAQGQELLKEGAANLLKKELAVTVRQSIESGGYRASDEALNSIVSKVARDGLTDTQKAQLKTLVEQSLRETAERETRSALKNLANQYALNMTAGATGGVAGGVVRGVGNWDAAKSVSDNLTQVAKSAATSAVAGTAGAAAITTAIKGAQIGYKAYARRREAVVSPSDAGSSSSIRSVSDNPRQKAASRQRDTWDPIHDGMAFRVEAESSGLARPGMRAATNEQVHLFDLNQGNLSTAADPSKVKSLVELARAHGAGEYGEHNALLRLVVPREELNKFQRGESQRLFWMRPSSVPSYDSPEKWVSLESWLKEQGMTPDFIKADGTANVATVSRIKVDAPNPNADARTREKVEAGEAMVKNSGKPSQPDPMKWVQVEIFFLDRDRSAIQSYMRRKAQPQSKPTELRLPSKADIHKEMADGTIVVDYGKHGGGMRSFRPDGTEVYVNRVEGSTVTRLANGNELQRFRDGSWQKVEHFQTGKYESIYTHSNGKKTLFLRDESFIEVLPDKTRIKTTPDGKTVTMKPDGTRITRYKDGKEMVWYEGGKS